MSNQSIIKNLRRRIENVSQPKSYDAHYEYEADGAYFFSAFTRRGIHAERFSVRLWFDADGALFGNCSCRREHCRHIQKSTDRLLGGMK